MMQFTQRTLLWDLDGTLIDSEEGVYRSICCGLKDAGLPLVPRELGRTFIGPPLEDSLHAIGVTEKDFQTVWDGYARAYRSQGLALTKPVPGMPEAVHRLKEAGFRMALASCKPWEYCVPILDLCGYGDCFEVVSGSFHNGVPENKVAVIQEALRQLQADPADILMIGDRASDALGAAQFGLPCLGVDFCGYAEPGEMEAAGASALVCTPEELLRSLGVEP